MSAVKRPQVSALPINFCIDCKHYTNSKNTLGACAHPDVAVVNLVTSIQKPLCSETRRHDGFCGPDGRLFAQAVGDSLPGMGNPV
jgi:hypothetical protein